MQRKLRESTGHRAQIRRRENITAMLEKLGDDATVFVKNENKLNRMLPGNQILKSLALRAKVELDNSSVPNRPQSVNKQFSVSERTPEQKKEILAQARRYASGEIGKDEFFRHVKQRIYSLKNV